MKRLRRLVNWMDAHSLTFLAAPLLPLLRMLQWRNKRELERLFVRMFSLMYQIAMKLDNRTYIPR